MSAASPDQGSLQPRALYEVIADHLRERILGRELHAGATLDEGELALYYGVSRTPVREALKVLSFEGLVETPLRRSVTVRAIDPAVRDEALALRELLLAHAERTRDFAPKEGAILPMLISLVEQRLRHTAPRAVAASSA